MKKLLIVLTIGLVSCESELPANIDSAVNGVIASNTATYSIDSLFSNLTKEQIDNLSQDSLSTLIAKFSAAEMSRDYNSKQLEELLKYSPEYSSHSKVKSKNANRYPRDFMKEYTNSTYMYELFSYRGFPKYLDKPVYGK